jgi:hypothetical protein
MANGQLLDEQIPRGSRWLLDEIEEGRSNWVREDRQQERREEDGRTTPGRVTP